MNQMQHMFLTLTTALAGGTSGRFARRSPTHLLIPVRSGERRADERGASLVEYALLVALIAIVCIAAVTLLGTTLDSQYSSVAEGLE